MASACNVTSSISLPLLIQAVETQAQAKYPGELHVQLLLSNYCRSLCILNNPTNNTKTQAYPPHNCTCRATLGVRHLTSQSNSVSKQSVGVSVVDVLLGSQATEEVVSVTTKVRGTLDLVEMGHLVQVGVSLILSVAGRRGGLKTVKVQVAVGHVASSRQGVRQNTVLA